MAATVAPGSAQRLTGMVVPEHYQLSFSPDLQAERFLGEARIRVKVLDATSQVVLHAVGLDVESATISAGSASYQATVTADAAAQTITVEPETPLTPGSAELHLTYRGVLSRELRGFYISEANGRKYAVTQLEATDARRMFPAFDEPRFKATFDIQATVPSGDTAISNGAVESVTPGTHPGTRTFDFATTRPMSTYLVALAVGDFECAHRRVGETPLGVCATPGNESLTHFALDAAAASLRYFNGYFTIDYPFSKLDLVAIPDFAAGAMENTGAVFFRESLLLVAQDASLATRKRAASVIAHELAHMWFGNLVTMSWWDDLWLNEGFATWMEVKALGDWKPEWDMELEELQATHSVMVIDAQRATRPVRVAAETADEIEALFDAIAYEKAAAVIGMAESFAGSTAWQRGINAYLAQHEYGNATAQDFWTVTTNVTGKPIDRVMRSFVERPGLPLVSLETACRGKETRVNLKQESLSRAVNTADPWVIPVCLETRGDDGADSCHLLDSRNASVALPGCSRWVIGNAGAEGYYRTFHGANALARLIAANAELAADERLMLVADHWALMRAGEAGLGPFFTVTRALAPDLREPQIISALGARLRFVHEYLTTEATRGRFETWVRELFTPMLATARKTLGDDDTANARRAALLAVVGGIGRDAEVLSEATSAVRQYLQGQRVERMPAEILDAYVDLAASTGDAALYASYLRQIERATTPEERYRFLYGLASFRDETLVRRTLAYARSEKVRAQDRATLIGRVLSNSAARRLAWEEIQAGWSELQAGLGAFGGATRIIESLGAFCDGDAARDIRAFFDAHPVPGSDRALAQTLEDIEACAALAATQRPRVSEAISSSLTTARVPGAR